MTCDPLYGDSPLGFSEVMAVEAISGLTQQSWSKDSKLPARKGPNPIWTWDLQYGSRQKPGVFPLKVFGVLPSSWLAEDGQCLGRYQGI